MQHKTLYRKGNHHYLAMMQILAEAEKSN